jgi:SPP1 family holin
MNRKTETILRTVILALALINQILTSLGYSPLPIDDEQIETLISVGFTVAAALWAWWKNNSVTKPAQQADNYLDAIKAAEKRGDYHV